MALGGLGSRARPQFLGVGWGESQTVRVSMFPLMKLS